MFIKRANYLHFYYVFSKIIHSYMFQSSYDHHQGVFEKIFPK